MVNSEITLYFWNEVSETYILYVFLWESKIRFLFFLKKKNIIMLLVLSYVSKS